MVIDVQITTVDKNEYEQGISTVKKYGTILSSTRKWGNYEDLKVETSSPKALYRAIGDYRGDKE